MIDVLISCLFPKYCLVCKKIGSYICLNCAKRLRFWNMRHMTHSDVTSIQSAFLYNYTLKKVITGAKYYCIPDVLPTIYSLIRSQPDIRSQYIVPIPLHPQKKKQRGFNQAEILSNLIAQDTRTKVLKHLLIRKKNTVPQAQTRPDRRKYNIQDVFDVSPRYKKSQLPKSLTLIDDVCTTGSTLSEAAKILHKHGVESVHAWTLARAHDP